MKASLQCLMVLVGTLGLTASPALGQLSALPPLQFCEATLPPPCPQYFVPQDGIALPGLEIIPWNSPRAVTFLNNLGAAVPPGSQLGQVLAGFESDAVTRAIQSGVNDPALINSFGRILFIQSSETPDSAQLQQAEADFIAWLQANVAREEGEPPTTEEPLVTEPIDFAEAVAEVLPTLLPEELTAISSSPQALQNFNESLVPQVPAAQRSLIQRGQESLWQTLRQFVKPAPRTFRGTAMDGGRRGQSPQFSPSIALDISRLNLHSLPTSETVNPVWVAQSSFNDVIRAEVESYRVAHAATDVLKAANREADSEEPGVAQNPLTRPTDGDGSGWSAFIAGDIAWGNTGTTTTANLNNYLILAGADYAFTPNFLLGAAIGYSTGSQRSSIATTEANSVLLNLYGTGEYGNGGYTTGFLGYGFDSFSSRRTILIPGANREATGSTSGNQFNIGVETGWIFDQGSVLIQPSLGLRYTSNTANGYTETGAGTLSTVIDGYSANAMIANLGINVAYPIATGSSYITPFLGAGLNHRFGDSNPLVTARFVGGNTSFVIPSEDIDRTWFDLMVGVSAELSPNTTGQVLYRTDIGRFDANINNISVNLRHNF